MKRKERIRIFRLHVIRDRQGTDSRLRSFRAEPLSEQIHKLASHENVNSTGKNGGYSFQRTAILKLSKPVVCALHTIATHPLAGEDGGEGGWFDELTMVHPEPGFLPFDFFALSFEL